MRYQKKVRREIKKTRQMFMFELGARAEEMGRKSEFDQFRNNLDDSSSSTDTDSDKNEVSGREHDDSDDADDEDGVLSPPGDDISQYRPDIGVEVEDGVQSPSGDDVSQWQPQIGEEVLGVLTEDGLTRSYPARVEKSFYKHGRQYFELYFYQFGFSKPLPAEDVLVPEMQEVFSVPFSTSSSSSGSLTSSSSSSFARREITEERRQELLAWCRKPRRPIPDDQPQSPGY